MPDTKDPAEEAEINAVAVNLADLVDDGDDPLTLDEDDVLEDDPLALEEDEEQAEEDEPEEKGGGRDGLADLMDDIFAEEPEEDDRLKAFGDLEHLTMIEVTSEVEAVLEELRIRQGGDE